MATLLFRSTGEAYYGTIDVSGYVNEWSILLLTHEHEEVGRTTLCLLHIANDEQFVGREQIDWIVLGLSSLLNWSFQVLQSLGKPLKAP